MGWLIVEALGSLLLFGGGLLGVAAWWGRPRAERGSIYWLLAGLGLIYLAADERLSLHERLGRALWEAGVPDPPGMNHLDDAILGAVVLAGFIVTLVFIPELLRHRRVLPALLLGGAATGVMLVFDGFVPTGKEAARFEESAELVGQGSLFLAMWLRWSEGRQRAGVAAPAGSTAPLPGDNIGP